LRAAGVDRWVRALEKASDHAPTWIELDWPAKARARKKVVAKKAAAKKVVAKKATAKKAAPRKVAKKVRT
jgi:exodeoxyribonuclease-3